jgi:hypothetical protein
VEAWAEGKAVNLRWRAKAIAEGQRLVPGCGVPDSYIAEAHDRALIGAFLPSRFDLEAWSQQWAVAKSRRAGRELGNRFLQGEDVSQQLAEHSYRPNYEAASAAFFNTLGADLTASIPQNIWHFNPRETGGLDEATRVMRRYGVAFAAATRSGELTFTAEDLLHEIDPTTLLHDRLDAAHLLTEPGIASPWLQYAARSILLAESYTPWVVSPDAVVAVARGLAGNPEITAGLFVDADAVETLLRRSTMLGRDEAPAIGDALVAVVMDASDRAAAARIAAETITAIGGKGARPHGAVMTGVAVIGGTYLDEIAWSLVAWEHDPTYRPRFEVERGTARRFLLETVRNAEAYAVILAATQAWIANVIAAEGPTTFADYTRRINNRADDIGMLLATIIGADRINGVEDAEEVAYRRAMLLDAIGGVVRMAANLAGPAAAVVQPAADLLEDRATDLLGADPFAEATAENDAFREIVLDRLRTALHEIIVDLELDGPEAELDPQILAEHQGAVLMQILATIYATMSQFEPDRYT